MKDTLTPAEFAAWRKRNRLTKVAAAEELGVHRNTVRNYETGASAVPKNIVRACRDVDRERLEANTAD